MMAKRRAKGGGELARQRRALLGRLGRIAGQVRGLTRMIERGKPAREVLLQFAAARGALARAADLALRAYLLDAARGSLSGARRRKAEQELFALLARHVQ